MQVDCKRHDRHACGDDDAVAEWSIPFDYFAWWWWEGCCCHIWYMKSHLPCNHAPPIMCTHICVHGPAWAYYRLLACIHEATASMQHAFLFLFTVNTSLLVTALHAAETPLTDR